MSVSGVRTQLAPHRFRSVEAGECGALGRLGRWTAGHFRAVLLAWVVFAPRAEQALSGAGWEAGRRVIFAAAAAMVCAFALSGPLPPKETGIILGLAVLLDAALIRLLLLPALLRLSGRAACWLPRWSARWLPRVDFGHAHVTR